MLIVSSSRFGGRPSKTNRYPLDQDKNGNFGIRLGYLEDGDKIIIKLSDAENFGNAFACTVDTFWSRIGKYFKGGMFVTRTTAQRDPENSW